MKNFKFPSESSGEVCHGTSLITPHYIAVGCYFELCRIFQINQSDSKCKKNVIWDYNLEASKSKPGRNGTKTTAGVLQPSAIQPWSEPQVATAAPGLPAPILQR